MSCVENRSANSVRRIDLGFSLSLDSWVGNVSPNCGQYEAKNIGNSKICLPRIEALTCSPLNQCCWEWFLALFTCKGWLLCLGSEKWTNNIDSRGRGVFRAFFFLVYHFFYWKMLCSQYICLVLSEIRVTCLEKNWCLTLIFESVNATAYPAGLKFSKWTKSNHMQ